MTTGHDMRGAKDRVTTMPGATGRPSADLQDTKVDVKVVLSGLWISMLFVFAYVDIFSFWRADVINGALDGKVPGAGFAINQTFLVLTTIYILIPSLMVMVSLIAPARINRTVNVVEVLLLLAIARVAWVWPRHSTKG